MKNIANLTQYLDNGTYTQLNVTYDHHYGITIIYGTVSCGTWQDAALADGTPYRVKTHRSGEDFSQKHLLKFYCKRTTTKIKRQALDLMIEWGNEVLDGIGVDSIFEL